MGALQSALGGADVHRDDTARAREPDPVPTAAPRVLVTDDEDDIRALVGLAVSMPGATA